MAPSGSSAPSPLMPRSPSNQNISANQQARAKELPLRKPSLKASSQADMLKKRPPPDYDMAEQLNREIEAKYTRGKVLGEGTYAVVYKGFVKAEPDKVVAIKKFKIQKDKSDQGINVDTIREIKYLQELSHNNIVRLYDVYSSKDQNINMVIEFFSRGNMEELIKDNSITYGIADIKAWMGMLCRALYYCHSNFVLHRDIKPGNLLIAADGEVKLADFGLARSFAEPMQNMTSVVITLWYRPPELLFGAKHYSGAVDMWSIGMIFAELLIRRPYCAYAPENPDQLERGGGEIGQLEQISQAVGTPTEQNWPGVSKLPNFVDLTPKVPVREKRFYEQMFPTGGSGGIDMLMDMLKLDPRKRATARQALEHSWWRTDPRPTDKKDLPTKGGGEKAMAAAEANAPGAIDSDRLKGVAKKLDFASMKK